jgi:hypothetical protein
MTVSSRISLASIFPTSSVMDARRPSQRLVRRAVSPFRGTRRQRDLVGCSPLVLSKCVFFPCNGIPIAKNASERDSETMDRAWLSVPFAISGSSMAAAAMRISMMQRCAEILCPVAGSKLADPIIPRTRHSFEIHSMRPHQSSSCITLSDAPGRPSMMSSTPW